MSGSLVVVRRGRTWQSACMKWTGRADEAAALGLLLDRTYAEAATAAARPRLLDREFLIGQFDLWDNFLLPALAAGTAPLWTRRPAARAVWHRLGVAAQTGHRRWMADHLDGLGLDPAALLGPDRAPHQPFRSGDGRVTPVPRPLTAESADLIGDDYDLTGGKVAGARMQVHGAGLIGGFLKLSAGARSCTSEQTPEAELHFRFDEATSFVLAHAEPGTVRTTGPPTFKISDHESALDVPATGTDLRWTGSGITWWPEDAWWEQSATARAAGEGTRDDEPAGPDHTARGTDILGVLQLQIMRHLRRMRHAHLLRRIDLAAAGALCEGLNESLCQVQPTALRARWAARRLRTMLATEDPGSQALLRQISRTMPLDLPAQPAPAAPAPVRITVGTAARLLNDLDFTGGRLRFVDVTTDRTVIHLDARRAGRETIVVIVLTEPVGCAPLTVTPDGLTLTGRPVLEATADDIALTIALPSGDWTVRAAAGSWYVD